MSRDLWLFVGSVPVFGDYALVWASDEMEVMREGRAAAGYDDDDYEDADFQVRLATASEILGMASTLLMREQGGPVVEAVLDTPTVRSFLAEQVRAYTSG